MSRDTFTAFFDKTSPYPIEPSSWSHLSSTHFYNICRCVKYEAIKGHDFQRNLVLLAQIAVVLISSIKISLGKHAIVIQLYVFARLRCQIRRERQALPCIFLLITILQGHLPSPLIASVQGNLGLDGLYEFGNAYLPYETFAVFGAYIFDMVTSVLLASWLARMLLLSWLYRISALKNHIFSGIL